MEGKAEQYYPTYLFNSQSRDVVLAEFKEAQKIANGQTKVYGQLTNILLAVTTILIPLLLNQNEKNVLITLVDKNGLLFSVVVFLFGALLLRYFVDLQKQITINARKVVTLRTLLGLDYGSIQLTLPSWRVEGATNPFAIKYFNGWFNFKSTPFWVLLIGVNVIWWLAIRDREAYLVALPYTESLSISWRWGNIMIFFTYLYIFRTNLNDTHETNYLNIVKLLASILGLQLADNFEYVIYRSKLAVVEIDRLKVDYENLKKILVEVEDRSFYSNSGISIRALCRAMLSQIPYIRQNKKILNSGGSTITMQLARSLFIPSKQNKYLRKIFEIFFSFWLAKAFTKSEILKLYIVSVRYDRGVLRLSNALKYFFGTSKSKKLSIEESFFLAERLSSVTGKFRRERMAFLAKKISIKTDINELDKIYAQQMLSGKVRE